MKNEWELEKNIANMINEWKYKNRYITQNVLFNKNKHWIDMNT
jgi:hypothetical protein